MGDRDPLWDDLVAKGVGSEDIASCGLSMLQFLHWCNGDDCSTLS